MKKNKKARTGNQPPLNINISFNINPKNILHSQHQTDMKFSSSIIQPNQHPKTNSKSNNQFTRTNHFQHVSPTETKNTKSHIRKLSNQTSEQNNIQQLKKHFFAKINNLDIDLPTLLPENHQENHQAQLDRSSIMSAKMEKYDPQTEQLQQKLNAPSINLNLPTFQQSKSKILTNFQYSKPLTFQKKNDGNLKKHSLSVIKTQSKWYTQQKGRSCFTDRKINGEKVSKKREVKKGQKQLNLKQKLQKFKIDLMKLAMVYEQTQVLKTKMSSEYQNVRSREISKQNVVKMSEGQECEQIHEIRQYQDAGDSNKQKQLKEENQKNQLDEFETQQFTNFKSMYDGLKRQTIKNQDDKQSTHKIIDYYKQLSLSKIQNSSQISQNSQKESGDLEYPSKLIFDKKIESEQSIEKERNADLLISERDQQNVLLLNDFLKFAKQRSATEQNSSFNQVIDRLFNEYIEARQALKSKDQVQKAILYEKQYCVSDLDEQINKQLSMIPSLKESIVSSYNFQTKFLQDIEIWEQCCKQEFLKIKGKMWREYNNIKLQVDNRIKTGNNTKPFKTIRSKRTNCIMKCLSQKILRKNSSFSKNIGADVCQDMPLQLAIKQQSIEKKQNNIITRGQLKKYRQPDEHLKVQMSEQEMSDQEDCKPPQFMSSGSIQEQKTQVQQKQIQEQILSGTIEFKLLKQDDKQDIFQFIFLDLCIELYQDYVEKQGRAQKKYQFFASERILNRIRQYITDSKRQKVAHQVKRIGISTNVNTIRLLVQQLANFLIKPSDSKAEVLVKKLNAPLGPSDQEILRSLRLAVLQDQAQGAIQEYQQGDLLVLQPEWFISFQNQVIHIQQLTFPKYYQSEQRDHQRINFLRNCTHIHHKAVFDCLNQHLDYHRVFGIWGKPFLWKRKSQFYHKIAPEHINFIIERASIEVVNCSTFACGLMVNKQQSLIKDIANDFQYLKRLQDERIYKLLQNFVIEMEEKWFFHDDEQAQILIEMSHIVWTILIKELLRDLAVIGNH